MRSINSAVFADQNHWKQPCMCLLLSFSVFYNARLSVVNVTQMCLETPVMCNNCKPFYLLPALINRSSLQRNGCECLGGGQAKRLQVTHHTRWHSSCICFTHPRDFLSLINTALVWHTSNHWAQQKMLIKEFNWCELFTRSTWGCASLLLNDTGVFRKPCTSAV